MNVSVPEPVAADEGIVVITLARARWQSKQIFRVAAAHHHIVGRNGARSVSVARLMAAEFPAHGLQHPAGELIFVSRGEALRQGRVEHRRGHPLVNRGEQFVEKVRRERERF